MMSEEKPLQDSKETVKALISQCQTKEEALQHTLTFTVASLPLGGRIGIDTVRYCIQKAFNKGYGYADKENNEAVRELKKEIEETLPIARRIKDEKRKHEGSLDEWEQVASVKIKKMIENKIDSVFGEVEE